MTGWQTWLTLIGGGLVALFLIGFLWQQVIVRLLRWIGNAIDALLRSPAWSFFWRHVGIGLQIVFVLALIGVALWWLFG